MSRYNSLEGAQKYAADRGIILTAEDYAEIEATQALARQRVAAANSTADQHAFIQRFNRQYPRLLKALHAIGDVLLTTSQTLIVSLGVPTVLVLLLFVEEQRVRNGIGLFEPDVALATFGSSAMVLLNLVIEFAIEFVELQADYHAAPPMRFSLRTFGRNVAYAVGLSPNWHPQSLSPAQRFRVLRRIVTYSILALALAGSMREVIITVQGTWLEALVSVLARSTLLQASTWIGGLLFALSAVLSAQGLSRYVAVRVVEILARLNAESSRESDLAEESANLAAAQLVIAKVRIAEDAARAEKDREAREAQERRAEHDRRLRELELQAAQLRNAESFQKFPEISRNSAAQEISRKLSESIGKDEALQKLRERPELMKWKGVDLSSEIGGSEPTWSRAKKEREKELIAGNGHAIQESAQ